MNWDERKVPSWFPKVLLYIFLAVGAFLALRVIFNSLSGFLVTLLVALFLSFAVEPAVDWMAERGWRRGPATGLVFFVLFVFGGLMIFLMINLVVQQVQTLVDDAPRLINRAADWVNERFNTNITTNDLIEQLESIQGDIATTAGNVGGRVLSLTSSVVGVVFQFFTIALFSFYMVAEGPQLRRTVCSVLPPDRQREILRLWDIAIAKTGGYLYSRLLLAIISAAAGWMAFAIIGIPSPLALALFMGVVAQFVPVVGTYIGGALPVLIALIDDPINAVWVLGYILIYQQIENYLLAPRITARTMAIHPAVAFGSAIVGASILGPIGALLALPAAAIVQAFVSSYINRYELIADDSELEAAVHESDLFDDASAGSSESEAEAKPPDP
jgi:predicted PurR-regulated permease PerM